MSLCCKRAKKVGRKFLNPVPTRVGGFSLVLKLLPQYCAEQGGGGAEAGAGAVQDGCGRVCDDAGERAAGDVVWALGLLVEMDGVRVLIDPVWEQRASPLSSWGRSGSLRRRWRWRMLPRIDAVLISHDHYDHLGAETVRRLAQVAAGARWVTSLGWASGCGGSACRRSGLRSWTGRRAWRWAR